MTTSKSAVSIENRKFSIDEFIDQKGLGFQHILIVLLCMIVNMIDGFDITAMAVVVADVGKEMQITDDKLGLVFSVSLAGMMLGAMFLASLSDVFGRRKVIIISLAVVGVSVLLTAYADNLMSLIVLRFISGLGAGAMLASQATLASEYSPDKYRALSVAIVTSGYPLGAMMTGIVAEVLVADYGWRSMFLLGGSVSLFMCFVCLFLMPESLQFLCHKKPKNALKKVNQILAKYSSEPVNELPLGSSESKGKALDKMSGGVIAKISLLLTPEYRSRTIMLWAAFLMAMCTLYFLMSWVPKLMVDASFSTKTANQAFSLFNFGGFAGILMMGLIATRLRLSSVVSMFLVIAALLMVVFAGSPRVEGVLLSLMCLTGLAMHGGFTGLYALAAKLYPTEIRSTGVGWALGVGRFGAVIGPAVAGFMIASGVTMEMNFLVFALPVVLSGICVYWLKIR